MRTRFAIALFGLAALVVAPPRVNAAEGASNFYLLGSKGSMAGFVPPPGTYMIDTNYYYTGKIDSLIPQAGILTVGLDAQAYYQIPTLLWVAPRKILGGQLGLGVAVPIGWKDVTAGAELNIPPPMGIQIRRTIEDDSTAFGDPVLNAVLGWNAGNWHWNVTTLVNVPVGSWQRGHLANIGFNHWGIDVTPAMTWLDPKLGLEISVAPGFTFNFENPDTNYRTGTEFHFELAVMQHLSRTLAVGLNGYVYDQLTGDSGQGARLGPFEGRVMALGPAVTYSFAVGPTTVSTSLKWSKEFDAENRLTGSAGQFTLSVPFK